MKLLGLLLAYFAPIHHAPPPVAPVVATVAPTRTAAKPQGKAYVAPTTTTVPTTTTTYPTTLVTDCAATWSGSQAPDLGGDPVPVHESYEADCPDVYNWAADRPGAIVTQVTNPVGGP